MRYLSICEIWKRAIVISLSVFMYGYNLGVVNTLASRYTLNFHWTETEKGNFLFSWKVMDLVNYLPFIVSITTVAQIFAPIFSIDIVIKSFFLRM